MNEAILQDLGLILLSATLVVLLARHAHVPSIVAYLLAGLVLGPGLGVIPVSESVDLISEAGIILLLFVVGLELSIEKIREVGRVALTVGGLQIAVTGLMLALILWGFGLSTSQTVFLAVGLTFSSTVVVVKLLDQLDALDSRHGRLAVGILLIQDLAVLVVLTFVAGLSGEAGLEPAAVLWGVARAFIGMGILLVSAALASRYVLPRLFYLAASSQEILLVGSLAWCFSVVLGSDLLGLSLELGGFIAGVSLAQLPHSHDLRRRVHPLMNFFVAVFFVSLGVHMELEAAASAWPLVSVLVLFTVIVKPSLVGWLLRARGERPRIALRVGITLGQTSEFSFILAALALSNGLIDDDLVSIAGAVGLVTMALSPFAIVSGNRIVEWIARIGALPLFCGGTAEGPTLDDEEAVLAGRPEGHVIVIGMNSLGRRIVQMLAQRGTATLAVDTDPGKLEGLPCRTLVGNAEYVSLLQEAGFWSANLIVSALRIEHVNRLLAYRARSAGVPSVIHAYDQASEMEIAEVGVTHLMNSRAAGVEKIIEELQKLGVFGA